jgi:hypothetical protein
VDLVLLCGKQVFDLREDADQVGAGQLDQQVGAEGVGEKALAGRVGRRC